MLGSLSQAANTAIASDVPGNGAPAMRLSNGTLHNLPAHIKKPEYPPAEVKPSIMLIGVPNFSRSLIGKMAQECLNKAYRNGEPLDMGILGVSLKSPDVKNALMPQDCNYTLTSKGVGVNQMEVIGSITKIHCAKENAPEIIEAAADPSITLIALTVTQKGYYTNAEGVNLEDIDIKNCLDPNNPELSTLGLLAHSLHIRMKNGTPPPVIMSCDNMSNNGTVLRNAVMAYAAAHPDIGSETAQWIAEYVPFPTTMVDRITPSWSREHDDYVRSQGISDAYPVLAEPMPKLPLVIEDLSGKEGTIGQVFRDSSINQLVGAGAIISDRVGAYEQMKVRLLNGIHMALGSIGHLMG